MLPGGSGSLNPLKEASAITQPLRDLQPRSSFSLSWLYCAPLPLPRQSRWGWEGVRLGLLTRWQDTHQCLAPGCETAWRLMGMQGQTSPPPGMESPAQEFPTSVVMVNLSVSLTSLPILWDSKNNLLSKTFQFIPPKIIY